jgi:hypothetical protein
MKKFKLLHVVLTLFFLFGISQFQTLKAQNEERYYRVYTEDPFNCTYGCYSQGGNCYSEEPFEESFE